MDSLSPIGVEDKFHWEFISRTGIALQAGLSPGFLV